MVTSDSIGLQELIGVSGDRQSASELARSAAAATRAQRSRGENLYPDHEAFQQQREAPQQVSRKEVTQRVHGHEADIGIGF